jgi:adhesin transport system membrane fusion protein
MLNNSLEKVELSPFVKKAKTITFAILLFILFMLFLPWEQTTKGEGELIAYNPSERDYTIHAPISGFIKSYAIEEDKFVKEGDLLFEMQDLDSEYLPKLEDIGNDINIERNNVQNTLNILAQQKNNLQSNLTTGLEIHERKIAQIEDSLRTLTNKQKEVQNNYEVTKSNYERIKLLFSEGIESKRSFELANNEYVKLTALLDTTGINIQRESKSLQIQKKEKDSFQMRQENAIKSMQNQIIASENRLKTLDKEMTNASINISRNANANVYATKDGYPLRVLKNDKDRFVKQGDALIHFAPKVTKRVLLIKIKAIDMPLIKQGLNARIQFYGWPSLQVSGWPKITYGTFGGIIDKIDPIAHEAGAFYAYIVEDPKDPWPDDEVLKVGTRATAWIRLSTVQIWYEIWRLHNAMPLKMIKSPGK